MAGASPVRLGAGVSVFGRRAGCVEDGDGDRVMIGAGLQAEVAMKIAIKMKKVILALMGEFYHSKWVVGG
jgi:hypothetical protein